MSDAGNTADIKEIERFNQLAETWWMVEGPMWPLHLLNQFRIRVILDVLSQQGCIDLSTSRPLEGMTALDIGCGGGILSESLCKLGAQVTGIDMAVRNIAIARQHAEIQNLNITYLHNEVSSLTTQYDLVFNMEVVEHVADSEAFLNVCSQRVGSDATLFLSTINRTVKSYLFAILGAEYVLGLLPRGTHQWRKFVTPAALESQMSKHNLSVVWRSGVSLNPFTRQYKLIASEAVNYMMAIKRP